MEEGNQSGDMAISGGHGNAQEEYAMRRSGGFSNGHWLSLRRSLAQARLKPICANMYSVIVIIRSCYKELKS